MNAVRAPPHVQVKISSTSCKRRKRPAGVGALWAQLETTSTPLKRGNELIGAIGVSGASSQEDEEIARAGPAAL